MNGKIVPVFLAAVLLLPLWRGDRHTTGTARGEVQAASSATTKKLKDVALGEVIQIGVTKYVKIAANSYQAVKPYTCADPVLTYAGASKSFTYTGNYQTFTAYAGCQYQVELWGAQGNDNGSVLGGRGSYTAGLFTPDGTSSLYVYVGQHQQSVLAASFNCGSTGPLNHGGDAVGYGGGGATDIRTVSGTWDNENSLRSRIIVAAGGGGSKIWGGCNSVGSQEGIFAGGISGYTGPGSGYAPNACVAGTGGTQVAGGSASTCTGNGGTRASAGSFGKGGNPGSTYSAGGGGGWYGGGGGTASHCYIACGGSGSSYISGHTGCVGVTSLSDTTPKSGCTTGTTNNACSLSPTGLSFTDTVMIDGAGYSWTNVKGSLQQMPNPAGGYYASGVGHTGNGAARITRLN